MSINRGESMEVKKDSAYLESILHVDMDSFFVSVERVLNPKLNGLPVVVGGDSNRGVVASASYEARSLGIHSAMPIITAKRICKKLIIIPTNMVEYQRFSAEIMDILESYTPVIEPCSIDEAYLDVSGAIKLFGSPLNIATKIREDIKNTLSLPASVGIASNKQLAKLSSNMAKPDGIYLLENKYIRDLLDSLPIGKLHGIGSATVKKLERYSIYNCSQVLDVDRHTLERILGENIAHNLINLCKGIDTRPVTIPEKRKSIGAERTFHTDLVEAEDMKRELLRLSGEVAARVRKHNVVAKTVTLKLKTSDFVTTTRSTTFPYGVDDTTAIYSTIVSLFDNLSIQRIRVRLLGVTCSNLSTNKERQLSFGSDDKWQQVDKAIDKVTKKLQGEIVTRGSLLADDNIIENKQR